MDHLRAKCTSSVNLIKHVSHLSWGADRKTLQGLYTTLVQSKLEYGAQVYGTSKSNEFKRLEPIQNACLRAITGAFRSSPAVSLCVETVMLPLDFSCDMLTLKHFFKIQSLPNSRTHRALIGPLGDPTPRMEHIDELCTRYQVQTPKILTLCQKSPLGPIHLLGIVHYWKQRSRGYLTKKCKPFSERTWRGTLRCIFIQMALSPPKLWALQQCFLTPPVVADLPERLQYSQQNCMQ